MFWNKNFEFYVPDQDIVPLTNVLKCLIEISGFWSLWCALVSFLVSDYATVFREVYMTMTTAPTVIVNSSLNSALMPAPMKEATVNPILKKPHLDKDTLNNYRSVSNLPFVSKLIEQVVVKQPVSHLEDNNLSEKYQSAYRQFHATETALTSVLNTIFMSLDQQQAVFHK